MPANSRVMQHNLDVSGRTSGSLVFDHQGYIIGMNFAGIYRVAYDQGTGKPTRIVSENPGLAIRVDELWHCCVLASGAGRVVPEVSRRRTDVPFVLEHEQDCPHRFYRPFPDGWNGRTILP